MILLIEVYPNDLSNKGVNDSSSTITLLPMLTVSSLSCICYSSWHEIYLYSSDLHVSVDLLGTCFMCLLIDHMSALEKCLHLFSPIFGGITGVLLLLLNFMASLPY